MNKIALFLSFFVDIFVNIFKGMDTVAEWVIGNPIEITVPYANGKKTTTYKWFRVIHVNYHK